MYALCLTINKRCFYPAEVDKLIGDPSKAIRHVSWQVTATL